MTDEARLTPSEVEALLRRFVGVRMVVVGDAMLDTYVSGDVSRICPEAPVAVLEARSEDHRLGGAANVAKCLSALGADVQLVALVGEDAQASTLLAEARALGIRIVQVVVDASRPTTQKTRIMAQRQQLLRIDREATAPASPEIATRLSEAVSAALEGADGVLLSDYGKGVLVHDVCQRAIDLAQGRPVVVDPKGTTWARFRGATLLKPNVRDARAWSGLRLTHDDEVAQATERLRVEAEVEHALVTRGERGMTLASAGGVTALRAEVHEVFDVVGAGDVVAAVTAMALAAGADAKTAAWLANIAAGVKVTKAGAAAVAPAEILNAVRGAPTSSDRKVLSLSDAASFAARARHDGREVVFTNGCFDILHYGHVSYLEKARKLGDTLIVGVNTDASVRKLKGSGRPIQNELDRARILASQASVDAVVLFDDDTPLRLIEAVKPDVLCKGSDYARKEDIVGWDRVESWGGRVERIEFVEGRSTTSIVARGGTTKAGA